MLRDHDYAAIVRDTLGHAAAATGLIAQSLKFDGTVTMQLQGRGELRMLVMQSTSELELRGMAAPAPDVSAKSFGELMRAAHCAITVDTGEHPYQGIVEIKRQSLAASLENYFLRSVQVPSHVSLVSDASSSGGLLLQQMPGQPIDADEWHRLGLIAATLRHADFETAADIELIGKLFREDDVRVFKSEPVAFRCRCSRERADQVLRMLGEAEIRAAVAADGHIDVTT